MTLHTLASANPPDELTTQVVALYAQYQTATCAYLYSLLGEWNLANDLNQELYLRLFRTRIQLPGIENPRAWVYQIATNLALNAIKRRKRFAWLPWHQASNEAQLTWQHDLASATADRERLEQALVKVPADYRAVLLLFSGHGFSIREIATALQISEGAVKVRLHRARAMFAEVYEEENHEPQRNPNPTDRL
jgi:RNA polymerase sigma-70 factor, ECF subfamily